MLKHLDRYKDSTFIAMQSKPFDLLWPGLICKEVYEASKPKDQDGTPSPLFLFCTFCSHHDFAWHRGTFSSTTAIAKAGSLCVYMAEHDNMLRLLHPVCQCNPGDTHASIPSCRGNRVDISMFRKDKIDITGRGPPSI